MHHVLILGSGKIGSTIAYLLAHSGNYEVHLTDIQPEKAPDSYPHLHFSVLDSQDPDAVATFLQQHPVTAVVSCLPYYHNLAVAKQALKFNLHYFDLTEDTKTTAAIAQLAESAQTAFIPQCGLAPGFIDIVANDLISHFATVEEVKLRCGALPEHTSNALQYCLTWSTDGLINEYGNPCIAIENGKEVLLPPLSNLEDIQIDGLNYEAFNTSGGIGSLVQTYRNQVKFMNYKSIRYPGHCEKMRFLMQGLKLNQDRETLKKILENAIPATTQDVVLVYVSVNGTKADEYVKETYVQKFYPDCINQHELSAIQTTTARSLCAVLDTVLSHSEQYQGWIRQERFNLQTLLDNPFGYYFNKS